MPSMPSVACRKAPNFIMLVMGPSTTEPTGKRFAASAQGSPSACFNPSESRCSTTFTARMTTSTLSPPRDFRDVQQAIHAPQVDKGAVVGKAAHRAGYYVAFAHLQVTAFLD